MKPKEIMERNMFFWKSDFENAFRSSFKDDDMFNSCLDWIDTMLIERKAYVKICLNEFTEKVKFDAGEIIKNPLNTTQEENLWVLKGMNLLGNGRLRQKRGRSEI